MPDYLRENLQQIDQYEISLYTDELTTKGIVSNIKRIKLAFPQLESGFYDVLTDMVRDDKFTDQRFKDAVDHVIRTCVYPQPTIAQFLSFDKKLKINSYNDMCKLVEEFGRTIWDDYNIIDMPSGKKGWVKK